MSIRRTLLALAVAGTTLAACHGNNTDQSIVANTSEPTAVTTTNDSMSEMAPGNTAGTDNAMVQNSTDHSGSDGRTGQ